jgi:hypothetical protein
VTAAGLPLTLRLELSASLPVLCVGAILIAAAAAAVVISPLHPVLLTLSLLIVTLSGARGLWLNWHGRAGAALKAIEWQGGDRWLLWRGDGRQARARLHPRSRRIGLAALLVFRRGGFSRFGQQWVLVLPHMVNDGAALRRLRARLTLQGESMRGRAIS